MADAQGERGIDDQVVSQGLQAEHRAEQQERRAGRPRLRAARRRVLDRVLRRGARIAAERFGQPAVEELGSVKDPRRDPRRFLLEPVSAQAPGDERVVEGPDRADVIADRVVAASRRSAMRAHAPAGEQLRPHQVLARQTSPSTCPRSRSRAGGRCWTRASRPACRPGESEREVAAVGDPEVAVEAALEIGRLFLELVGEHRVLPDLAREACAAHLGVVGVALQLAGRAREAWEAAVPVRDRVPGVLPALVLEARSPRFAADTRCIRCPGGPRIRRSSPAPRALRSS